MDEKSPSWESQLELAEILLKKIRQFCQKSDRKSVWNGQRDRNVTEISQNRSNLDLLSLQIRIGKQSQYHIAFFITCHKRPFRGFPNLRQKRQKRVAASRLPLR